jgi:3-oxoacyl-[acyl-carrier-protein] synthase II
VLAGTLLQTMQNAAWVTGYGLVSPLGQELAAFDEALFAGRSALSAYTLSLPGFPDQLVPIGRCDFNESAVESATRVPLDRGSAMALVAGRNAAALAGLVAGSYDPLRIGIYWGSGMGGAATLDHTLRSIWLDQRRIRPTSVVSAMPNAPLGELALHFGARGAAIGYACACASAAVAIGEALSAIRAGRIDVAIAGGSEALLVPSGIGGWHAMRVLAPIGDNPASACRPFAADRNGFALGEGAAAVVLESAAHARARGAKAHSALSGYATNCDGLHMTQPDAAGQVRAMRSALADAGLQPSDIGHVNSHGTATTAGDAAEATSLATVFGARQVPVTATKSLTGHLLGAGGAVELIALLRSLERGLVSPVAHQQPLDAAFEIDLVQGAARAPRSPQHAMSNSFAFGGTNAVLIASRLG